MENHRFADILAIRFFGGGIAVCCIDCGDRGLLNLVRHVIRILGAECHSDIGNGRGFERFERGIDCLAKYVGVVGFFCAQTDQ